MKRLDFSTLWGIAAVVGIVALGAAIGYFTLGEDPRTRYDKEGRYVPAFCLRELAVAMHAYHKQHGRLPPAALCSEDGTPLLSWRVLLLPFIEQEALFREFALQEPWDSPHNIKLLSRIPYTYRPFDGTTPSGPNETFFQVFVGKGTPFEGPTGWRLRKDIPRTSYTLLIVEADRAVPWTKPEDIAYDETRPLPKSGAFFPGYFHVAMADGTTQTLLPGFKEAAFRAAILREGDGPLLWEE